MQVKQLPSTLFNSAFGGRAEDKVIFAVQGIPVMLL